MIGARKINAAILAITSTLGAAKPACAIAAPAKPPISVCDELEGIPNHQVKRFQKIAANKPAKITDRLIYSS
jgi:hypothetical protein